MMTISPFPDTAVGGHLEWYFEVRVRGHATREEIEAHFAPEYRWGWGSPREPDALAAWFDRWRSMRARIEEVERLGTYRYVVTTRLEGGAVARVWFDMEDVEPHRILRTATTEHEAADGPADFGEVTTVRPTEEGPQAEIPAVFTTAVGPFGGYVAALAVAVGRSHTDKSVPLSLSGHFLNAGRSGPVQVDCATLRASSRLESHTVRLAQNGTVLFDGLVWGAEPSTGPAHGLDPMPVVPSPIAAAEQLPEGRPFTSFGGSMEAVPIDIGEDPSTAAAWVRLQPRSCFGDAWTDAARLLLPIDWLAVNATVRPHREREGFVVPSTLDVSVGFHHHDHATEWVLCRAASPVAGRGYATAAATVWSQDGYLLATSTLQILHRGA